MKCNRLELDEKTIATWQAKERQTNKVYKKKMREKVEREGVGNGNRKVPIGGFGDLSGGGWWIFLLQGIQLSLLKGFLEVTFWWNSWYYLTHLIHVLVMSSWRLLYVFGRSVLQYFDFLLCSAGGSRLAYVESSLEAQFFKVALDWIWRASQKALPFLRWFGSI